MARTEDGADGFVLVYQFIHDMSRYLSVHLLICIADACEKNASVNQS